ncbi:MAG: hypothetical protein ACWA5L_07385 [bacterium]
MAIIFHGALLPFTVGNTYDAYIHMFFADHYHRSWFEPWDNRWYTGFVVTAYPPGSHQLVALMYNILPLKAAFISIQLLSIILLTIGVYRFSKLWVSPMAAANASILLVFSTFITETIHVFGQLPTTLSIAIFLNGTPYIYKWIIGRRLKDLVLSLIFTAAAASVHHVTPIFGTLLFVGPLGVRAWSKSIEIENWRLRGKTFAQKIYSYLKAPLFGGILGGLMLVVIIMVVFPYWYWSMHNPIDQVSIPHGSRENFLIRLDLGLMFFLIPWGALLFFLPFAIWKTFTSRLWPLGLSLLLCTVLGTGGTTPLPEMILGGAFWILTLDRFTFWAALMILPFAGLAVESLRSGNAVNLLQSVFGRHITKLTLAFSSTVYVVVAIAVAILPLMRPTQPKFIDPTPIVQFMNEDGHNKWRYLTLGFGDQFAYHSALINGASVDGNYHSVRKLPSLTSYSIERLENSKYLGVPGLASLNQFLVNANKFNLKYIFSNDEFYDPGLFFTGWNPVTRLRNGVMVWEKPGINPRPLIEDKQVMPKFLNYMWGIIPPGVLILMLSFVAIEAMRGRLIDNKLQSPRQHIKNITIRNKMAISYIRVIACLCLILAGGLIVHQIKNVTRELSPDETIERYFTDLDFRDFDKAYHRLEPMTRGRYAEYLRTQRSAGGMVSSYSKLLDIKLDKLKFNTETTASTAAHLTYLTAVGVKNVTKTVLLHRIGHQWYLDTEQPSKHYIDRTVLNNTSHLYQDISGTRQMADMAAALTQDRPRIGLGTARLVAKDSRLHIVGTVINHDIDPACITITAILYDENSREVGRQDMGHGGIHRLGPGETRNFRIDYEGFLKIREANLNDRYDPDFYSIPDFTHIPKSIKLEAWANICSPKTLHNIRIKNIRVPQQGLHKHISANFTNLGSIPAGIVQIRTSFFDRRGRLIWVEPSYLDTNLTPGEIKQENIALIDPRQITLYKEIDHLSVNGYDYFPNATLLNQAGTKLQWGEQEFTVALSNVAMPYEALR